MGAPRYEGSIVNSLEYFLCMRGWSGLRGKGGYRRVFALHGGWLVGGSVKFHGEFFFSLFDGFSFMC